MKIKKYQNTAGPLQRDTITISELPKGYLFKYGNRTVVFPSGKRMTLNEARKEYAPSHIKISNLPGYDEYQSQLPYQEQNDIATAREIEKAAADRFVGSEYSTGNQLYTYLLKPIEGILPSRIAGATTTDDASGFADRFTYAWNPQNKGFFELNDYTRNLYDQDTTGAAILNLAGDFVLPMGNPIYNQGLLSIAKTNFANTKLGSNIIGTLGGNTLKRNLMLDGVNNLNNLGFINGQQLDYLTSLIRNAKFSRGSEAYSKGQFWFPRNYLGQDANFGFMHELRHAIQNPNGKYVFNPNYRYSLTSENIFPETFLEYDADRFAAQGLTDYRQALQYNLMDRPFSQGTKDLTARLKSSSELFNQKPNPWQWDIGSGTTGNKELRTVGHPRIIKEESELPEISRLRGDSPIPTNNANANYFTEQKLLQYDDATGQMVSKGYKTIDEVPNLKQTIENIKARIKTEDIRPEFLNDATYINSFRDNATRQGIDVSSLSNEDIAKILTEQYQQLSETSSGLLKDQILWRTWGRDWPQAIFDWQGHLESFTGNKGFWGSGNYFGTGRYGSDLANQPYMIKGIKEIGYDDILGATDKAGEIVRSGGIAGEPLATRWMEQSPDTRMVAATENGFRNRYGFLDTNKEGIEVVTQKNTGIKSLNPDLTIGDGYTFPRSWFNPDAFKTYFPFLLGGTSLLFQNK